MKYLLALGNSGVIWRRQHESRKETGRCTEQAGYLGSKENTGKGSGFKQSGLGFETNSTVKQGNVAHHLVTRIKSLMQPLTYNSL